MVSPISGAVTATIELSSTDAACAQISGFTLSDATDYAIVLAALLLPAGALGDLSLEDGTAQSPGQGRRAGEGCQRVLELALLSQDLAQVGPGLRQLRVQLEGPTKVRGGLVGVLLLLGAGNRRRGGDDE